MVEAAQSAGRGCEKRPNASRAALKCVVCNAELERRRPRAADFAGESHALASLVDALAGAGSHADGVLQQLAEAALTCAARTRPASACPRRTRPAMRSSAGARPRAHGELSGTAMPRACCFCCVTLESGTPMLMQHPERHFPRLDKAPPLVEVLMVPFHIAGTAVGTVWVAAHDEARHFDAEDLRLLMRLSRFAAMACQLLRARQLRAELTAERAQEARLSADIDALHAADRRKDAFLATLAHELRSPLASIRHAVPVHAAAFARQRRAALGTRGDRKEDRRRAAEAGFDHHVVKPVDFDALALLLAGSAACPASARDPVRTRDRSLARAGVCASQPASSAVTASGCSIADRWPQSSNTSACRSQAPARPSAPRPRRRPRTRIAHRA